MLILPQGPLVGEKRSSHAITEEYAKADPVYVAKTAVGISASLTGLILTVCKALPRKFSHYRSVLGDGNCGWRGKSNCTSTSMHVLYDLFTLIKAIYFLRWLMVM